MLYSLSVRAAVARQRPGPRLRSGIPAPAGHRRSPRRCSTTYRTPSSQRCVPPSETTRLTLVSPRLGNSGSGGSPVWCPETARTCLRPAASRDRADELPGFPHRPSVPPGSPRRRYRGVGGAGCWLDALGGVLPAMPVQSGSSLSPLVARRRSFRSAALFFDPASVPLQLPVAATHGRGVRLDLQVHSTLLSR